MHPLLPLSIIPFIVGGLVTVSVAGLYALSRVTLKDKIAKLIILGTGLIVASFTAFVVFELFTAKKADLVHPIAPPASESPR